jgi:hypothetical protein
MLELLYKVIISLYLGLKLKLSLPSILKISVFHTVLNASLYECVAIVCFVVDITRLPRCSPV